jgi:SdrD B-like protein
VVYLDLNTSGEFDSGEPPVAGVLVTVTGADGQILGSARSGSDGRYVINVPAGVPLRVEFTDIPPDLSPTLQNSTIRFLMAPNCNVDLGLLKPKDFCEADPLIAANCYVFGDPTSSVGPIDVVVGFPFSAGANNSLVSFDYDIPPHSTLATAMEVGATFGLAWQRSSETLFAASFMKRHSGFGPDGPGAIYRIDPKAGGGQSFVDLNALFGSPVAGADPHRLNDFFHDPNSWDAVGKISFGGMDFSDDDQILWVMNLNDRSLYGLPVGNPPQVPAKADVLRFPVPMNQTDCPNPQTDIRPFAVAAHDAQVYVGVVCSAESTGRTADLRAYIYAVNSGSGAYQQVFNAALSYPRLCADSGWLPDCGGRFAAWQAWTKTPIFTNTVEVHPEPWLTDLAFDHGQIILGLRDRWSDQRGYRAGSTNTQDSNLYSSIPAGDILRACSDGLGHWSLESNGSCGGVTTAGAGNRQGPGNGEFYFEEDYAKIGDPQFIPRHDEIATGGLVQLPASGDVMSTAFDPIPIEAPGTLANGGTIRLSNSAGTRSWSYRVYSQDSAGAPLFGKANGLGDLEALCQVPIEIGNRIWFDINSNGIQDAAEPGVRGVVVQLYSNGTLLGETLTDSKGEYYFNPRNILAGIRPNTAYSVRIVVGNGPLKDATLSPRDQGADDLLDSDGALVNGAPEASIVTGAAGQMIQSVDFGFMGQIISPPLIGPSRAAEWVWIGLSLLALSLTALALGRMTRRRS